MVYVKLCIEWRGIHICITHNPDWPGHGFQQIEVRSDERLPITETRYRSHYIHDEHLPLFDSVEAFVLEWLENAADDPTWKKYEIDRLQLSLFD